MVSPVSTPPASGPALLLTNTIWTEGEEVVDGVGVVDMERGDASAYEMLETGNEKYTCRTHGEALSTPHASTTTTTISVRSFILCTDSLPNPELTGTPQHDQHHQHDIQSQHDQHDEQTDPLVQRWRCSVDNG